MKAETETIVAEIEKSLELLRQRLGWDDAERRLEELNAFAEDPDLWNDPTKAQKLMRDRQKLSDSIDAYKSLAQELEDNQELIELGEMEEDADVVAEAESALAKLRDVAAEREIEALLNGETGAYRDAVLLNSAAALLIASRPEAQNRLICLPGTDSS